MNRLIALLLFVSGSALADIQADVAAKTQEVAALTQAIRPLVDPLLVSNADLRVTVSLNPVVDAVGRIATQPASSRSFSFNSTAANGHFWDSGPDWCNAYAELQGPGDLHVDGRIDNMSATIGADGAVSVSSVLVMHAHGQIHAQIMPHRTPIGNACIGGGVGTSIGISADKSQASTIVLSFNQADQNNVGYQVNLASPRHVDITASVGLGAIGNVGIPLGVDLPMGPLASGKFSILLARSGKFELPGGSEERSYDLVLQPVEFAASKVGIAAAWRAAAQLH